MELGSSFGDRGNNTPPIPSTDCVRARVLRRFSVGRDALCGWASVVCYATTTTNIRRIENARSCFDAQRLL